MNRNLLISFAADFVKDLIEKNGDKIRNIILFGSVARGDFDEKSDIDIFIDIPKVRKATEKQIYKILERFLSSKNYKIWKLHGIENDISIIIGNLKSKEWNSLRRSIISNGILLYGKYKERPENLKQSILFSYEKIRNAKKRITIYRKLFGYKVSNKKYPGILEKVDGKKLGPGTFIVPIEESVNILKIFRKMKISVKIYEIWLD